MRCEIKLDKTCTEPYACITTAEMTPEVQAAAQILSTAQPVLTGYREEQVYLLPQQEVMRVYGQQQKVYAQTAEGIFLLRQRLYELEQQLPDRVFVRISGSEIVNSRYIHHLDISLAGTIGVWLDGGVKTYASRRYVVHIKQFFGIGKGRQR